VCISQLVEKLICVHHLGYEPRLPASVSGGGAAVDHAGEVAIETDLELPLTDRAPQPPGHMKQLELDYRPRIGRPPRNRHPRIGSRPREKAMAVGVQQPVGRKFSAEAYQTIAAYRFSRGKVARRGQYGHRWAGLLHSHTNTLPVRKLPCASSPQLLLHGMTRQLALVIQHHLISSGWNLDPVAPETFHCCRRGLRPGAAVVPMQQWRSHAGVLHTNIANCPGSFNLTTPTAR